MKNKCGTLLANYTTAFFYKLRQSSYKLGQV